MRDSINYKKNKIVSCQSRNTPRKNYSSQEKSCDCGFVCVVYPPNVVSYFCHLADPLLLVYKLKLSEKQADSRLMGTFYSGFVSSIGKFA